MKLYNISEIFFSRQGEGVNVGDTAIFIRFGGCNLKCELKKTGLSPGGFNCDTDFMSSEKMTEEELKTKIFELHSKQEDVKWVVFTGGEPMLQLNSSIVDYCKTLCLTAIETNGTINCDNLGIDWICVSPKVAEHCIKQLVANEVKYVRGDQQPLPKTNVVAEHYLISPAFEGLHLPEENYNWCKSLVKNDQKWKMSVQQHKMVNIR